MSQTMMSRRETTTFLIASLILFGAAAAVGFMQTASPPIRGAMIALLLATAILQLRSPDRESPSWWIHLYLGIQGALNATLMFLIPGWTMFPALFCIYSVQAVLLLSLNPGILWVVAYVAVIGALFALRLGWDQGLNFFFRLGRL